VFMLHRVKIQNSRWCQNFTSKKRNYNFTYNLMIFNSRMTPDIFKNITVTVYLNALKLC